MTKLQRTLHAVAIRKRSGKWMARQYALKHGVMGYYRLAWQLEAVNGKGL